MHHTLETYRVEGKRQEAVGITTLSLTDIHGNVPAFLPGQYITVFFSESTIPEGKAYSISSAPQNPVFEITVRAIGEFSNRLSALEVGDTFEGSLPYGFFGPESDMHDLVMLASGIGVTPFRSMIRNAAETKSNRRMYLFHSIRTHEDAIFAEEFNTCAPASLVHTRYVTREDGEQYGMQSGRIHAARVLEALPPNADFEFLLCGSISFTRDMWRDLKQHGVSEDRIYTEAFFTNF